MSGSSHITGRRGFIAGLGFGAVSLYGVWAAYGAAPGPLALLGLDEAAGGGHDGHAAAPAPAQPAGGHGGHGGGGMAPEEFERLVEDFMGRYRLADGSVHPRRLAAAPAEMAHDEHGGMAMAQPMPMMPGMQHDMPMEHDMPTMQAMPMGEADHPAEAAHDEPAAPLDVYLLARRWGYAPDVLRLDAGVPYRFRMMAVDITHGASIHIGAASRMIRLRPGALAEQSITFRRPGTHLVYCTAYCGAGHDAMQGRIVVV